MTAPSLLVLAGEASGDHHAAQLVSSLKRLIPDVEVTGIGGDKLRDAGARLLHHYKEINTIGLTEGLGKIRHIFNAYNTMKAELRSGRHRVFLPVDYPDVNLRLCRIAKDAGVKVCFYISPQVWAWRKGRIRKIARRVDKMMTIFPFEEDLYREKGVDAEFVGHTMVQDIPVHTDKAQLRQELGIASDRYTVALVPGSRPAEIKRMLPVMAEAGQLFARRFPDAQFVLPLAGDHLSDVVNGILTCAELDVMVTTAYAPLLMAASDAGLITSGTATLQAALAGLPHALVYKVDDFTWWLGLRILKPLVMDADIHLAIANVLAINEEKKGRGPIVGMREADKIIPCQECSRPLFIPEVLQHEATPEALAEWLFRFRTDEELCRAMKQGFVQIRDILSPEGGRPRGAEIVAEMLDPSCRRD
jgi:lipid-A-disaccharide synthase